MFNALKTVALLSLLFITACQSHPQPEATQTLESLRPFLVTLEDVGWTSGYAKDSTRLAEDELAQDAEQYLGIRLSPFAEHPRYGPPNEPQAAGQAIFVYPDRETAVQAFETVLALGPVYDEWGPYEGNFDSRLENIDVGCNELYDPAIGMMQNCQAMIQYDRYVTIAYALADRQTVTMQDWATLLEVAQTKLFSQATQEPSR